MCTYTAENVSFAIDLYLGNDLNIDFLCYEDYSKALDLVFKNKLTEDFFLYDASESLIDKVKDLKISKYLVKLFYKLKTTIESIAKDFSISIKDLVIAFKEKNIFNILKAFSFNLKIMLKSINSLTKLIKDGLFDIFREISDSKIIKKLKSGVITVDEFFNKHPLLKKVTGIAVAGLLLYLWLNMTFIGNFDYDFNFTDLINALHGTFSLVDLFLSPEGLMLITLFGTGAFLGISVPWLGKSLYNLITAILYTGYVKLKNKEFIKKFKPHILTKLY